MSAFTTPILILVGFVLIAASVMVWRIAKAGGSVKLGGIIKIEWGKK